MGAIAIHQYSVGLIPRTPISPVWVAISENGLIALEIGGSYQEFVQALSNRHGGSVINDETRISIAIAQVTEYLNGECQHFDIPINWSVMTEFQGKTLRAVCTIPYGETRTYSQIASKIGMPGAQRAIGRANATNPIPIVIPCHRVIGADGNLRGYGGGEGIPTKAWLLELEKKAHPLKLR